QRVRGPGGAADLSHRLSKEEKMRHIIAAVARKFLPMMFMATVAPLVIEPIVRHQSLVDTWRSVYIPLLFAEPVLAAIGFLAAIAILRTRAVDHLGRHIAAAVIAV